MALSRTEMMEKKCSPKNFLLANITVKPYVKIPQKERFLKNCNFSILVR